MTSANVTNILQVPGQVLPTNGKSEDPTGEAFASLVDQALSAHETSGNMMANMGAKDSSSDFVNPKKGLDVIDESTKAHSFEKEQSKPSLQQDKISQGNNTKDVSSAPGKIDELKDELKKLDAKVYDVIEKDLEVSEDELLEAMELLGLTAMDLQDPSKLAALMNQLNGEENAASILMSSEFTAILEDLQTIFNDFSNEMGIEIEEINELVAMMMPVQDEQTFEEVIARAGETEIHDKNVVAEGVNDLNSKSFSQDETAIVSIEKVSSEDGETMEVKYDENGNQSQVVTQTADNNDSGKDFSKENSFSKDKGDDASVEAGKSVAVNANEIRMFDVAGEVSVDKADLPQQVDVQSIIDQIVERTTSQIAADSTQTIEMVLHPESYGKLILHVSADKEGNITAQIYTQNAEVKEALESQMAILRADMNSNHGGKVQAIEVTVSSHEFEENLEQDAARDERNAADQSQQNNHNKTRNINLNDLDELQGLMTEEEMLVASIMRDHGNTVNFTA